MALDPRIILAGQPLDVVGAMRQGNAAAAETNALRQQNQLTNLYQTQGAGIMAGDQSALNALAGIDPVTALNIQGTRQDMTYKNRQLEVLNAQEARALEEYKLGKDAAALAAEAQAIENAVKVGLALPDAASWDQYMAQNNPDLVGQFGNRQALAQKYMTMADILKQNEPPKPQDRYKVVGNTLFDIAAEGGPSPVGQGVMQEEVIMGPDGKPLIIRGGPGAGVKFTEGQSKDNVYVTRAKGALVALDPIAGELTSATQRAADIDPTGVVRGAVQSDDFQRARQAGDEFLQAILRKDTGAAITSDEQELYGKTYLPQPGDNAAVLEAKRVARQRAIAAMEAGMNLDQITATERALVDAAARAGIVAPSAPTPEITPSTPTGNVDGINWRIVE